MRRGTVEVATSSRFQVIDVTGRVESLVGSWGLTGLVVVYVPHTTAAVTVNEAEPGLMEDIIEALTSLFKPEAPWRHNRIDDNAHAHLAAAVVGNSRIIPAVDGKLQLGTWQRILFIELDGPRRRRLHVYGIEA